jgi:hypothetical protein
MLNPVLPISESSSTTSGILKRQESPSSNPCRRDSLFWSIFRLHIFLVVALLFCLALYCFGAASARSGGSTASNSYLVTADDSISEFNWPDAPACFSRPFSSPTHDCAFSSFFFYGISGSGFASHRSACSRSSARVFEVDVDTRNSFDLSTCVAVVTATYPAVCAVALFRSHPDHADVSLTSSYHSAGNAREQKLFQTIPFPRSQWSNAQCCSPVSLGRFPMSFESNLQILLSPDVGSSSMFLQSLCGIQCSAVIFALLLLLSICPFRAYFARAARIPASPSMRRFCPGNRRSQHKWTTRAMLAFVVSISPFCVGGNTVSFPSNFHAFSCDLTYAVC